MEAVLGQCNSMIVYRCFSAIVMELNSCLKDCMAGKVKIIYHLALNRGLLTSWLEGDLCY